METNTWEGQLKDLFLIMASGLQSMASWVHWASKTGWVCSRGWSTPIDQEVERQTNRKMHTTSSDFLQPDPTYLFKFPPLLKILAPHGIQALNTWVSGGHCISKSPQPWRPVGRGTIFFSDAKRKEIISTYVFLMFMCLYICSEDDRFRGWEWSTVDRELDLPAQSSASDDSTGLGGACLESWHSGSGQKKAPEITPTGTTEQVWSQPVYSVLATYMCVCMYLYIYMCY